MTDDAATHVFSPDRWVRNAVVDLPGHIGGDRRVGRDGSPLVAGPPRGQPATPGRHALVGLYDFSTEPTQATEERGDS